MEAQNKIKRKAGNATEGLSVSILFLTISGLLFAFAFGGVDEKPYPTDFVWASKIVAQTNRILLLIASGIFAIAGVLA